MSERSARIALPPAATAWIAPLRARWVALAPRERNLVAVAGGVLLLALVWLLLIRPAWRTMHEAPAQLDQLDVQWQQMQLLASEASNLRNTPPVDPAQGAQALQAATARLGEQRARLSVQGDRAVLTLTGVSGEQLRGWLAEARGAARARAVEAQLSRTPQGYSGTVVVAFGGASR
jgi:general secretion pathway protein M